MGLDDLAKLTDGFTGEIVRPDDPGYDAARAVWNSMIDRRPALIVRPTGNDDVVTALRFAREQELDRRRSVRRPQHPRLLDLRRRHRDRPLADARRRGRSRSAHRPRARRLAARRARRRSAGARARLPGRRRLPHRGGRPHARRRDGPAAAQARTDDRQPARGRARDRGRPGRAGKRGRESRALLGPARSRCELRDRDVVRVPACIPSTELVTHGTVTHPIERAEELAERYHELVGRRAGRAVDVLRHGRRRGRSRAGRVGVRACTAGRRRTRSGTSPALRALEDPLEDSDRVEAVPGRRSVMFDAPMEWGQRFSMKSSFLASLPQDAGA